MERSAFTLEFMSDSLPPADDAAHRRELPSADFPVEIPLDQLPAPGVVPDPRQQQKPVEPTSLLQLSEAGLLDLENALEVFGPEAERELREINKAVRNVRRARLLLRLHLGCLRDRLERFRAGHG